MQQRDSIFNTLVVAAVLCVVCSLAVSSAAVVLRPRQEMNEKLDQQRNILDATGLAIGEYGIPASDLSREQVDKLNEWVTPQLVDLETGEAHCRGDVVRLTEQELKLLKLFIKHRGRPLSRTKILEIGWGYTGEMTTRTVDNFIVRFRKYFEPDPKKPVFFKCVRSVGYLFDDGGLKEHSRRP